jgi:uncharacterized Tic20 family protein
MSTEPFTPPPEPGPSGLPTPGNSSGDGVVEFHSDARNWAMFAHLAALAKYTAIPGANILGPLIIWLMKKDQMPFVDDQGKEAINFQITITIALVVSGVLVMCFGIGIVGLVVFGIVDLVFMIIAAIHASGGKAYRYPMTLRLVK